MSRFVSWWKTRGRAVLWLGALAALASSPLWARAAASRLAFFRVRDVEVTGVRYVTPATLAARLRLDTLSSVWTDLAVLEARLADHPQVRTVRIVRRLPGKLVVRVTENLPVAMVPAASGFDVYDATGRALPIDPARAAVDLPILAGRDTALLRLLGEVRGKSPALFTRISDVRRAERGEVVVKLASLPVRAMADVSAERLAEIFPVEGDLVRRQARVSELDLRFRDQVIARLQ